MNTATSKTELYAAASALYGMFAELNKSLPGHPLSHVDTLAAMLTPAEAAALVRITRKLSDYRLNLDRNNEWAALEARCAASLDLEV